jgi:hypothetical protein
LELSSAGGAWGHLAAAVVRSPSLVRRSHEGDVSSVPEHVVFPSPIDSYAWDPEAVAAMLAEVGPDVGRVTPLDDTVDAYAGIAWPRGSIGYAYVARSSGSWSMELPHHTYRAGKFLINGEGCRQALAAVDSKVPPKYRDRVRKHLLGHLEEIRGAA